MYNREAVLDFRVPPEAPLSRVVRQSVSDFAASHGVFGDDLANFLTALGEAIANAIEHAHASEPIAIEVRLAGDLLLASVLDTGEGFASDPLAELPGPEAERGRGLGIMRRCSDIFNITSEPGKGTTVTLGRYLRRKACSAGAA